MSFDFSRKNLRFGIALQTIAFKDRPIRSFWDRSRFDRREVQYLRSLCTWRQTPFPPLVILHLVPRSGQTLSHFAFRLGPRPWKRDGPLTANIRPKAFAVSCVAATIQNTCSPPHRFVGSNFKIQKRKRKMTQQVHGQYAYAVSDIFALHFLSLNSNLSFLLQKKFTCIRK